jgi:hypothetical protein
MKKAPRPRSGRPQIVSTYRVLCASLLLTATAIAQEPTPQADSPDELQAAAAELSRMVDEAEALVEQGDMAGARVACQRALERAGLENASDAWLAAAEDPLWRLGFSAYRAGDLRSAHDAWEAVHSHRSKTLPDDHPDLQAARGNLALTKKALGDLQARSRCRSRCSRSCRRRCPTTIRTCRGALEPRRHQEGAWGSAGRARAPGAGVRGPLEDVARRPSGLAGSTQNLALTKYALGDLPGALALQEQVFASSRRRCPTTIRTCRPRA